jgi:hypothetical protein
MHRAGWLMSLIIVCVAVVFGRLATHEFTGWDDPHTISLNPRLNPPTLEKLSWYWTAIGEKAPAGLYIPMTYSVWGALARVAYLQNPDDMGIRLNPYVFHGANVLLHVLSAVVVFAILRLLLSDDLAACAGALVWGLHPVQVEPVGWASGMKDVLCGLLSLLAIWQYLQFARDRSQWWRYALATLAFIAAMFAKPSGVVVPVIAVILDSLCQRRSWGRAIASALPWLILTIPCILWTRASQSTIGVPTVPFGMRLFIATDSIAFYLYKLILPINLGVDYGHRPLQMVKDGWIWVTWIVPLAVAGGLWLVRRRAPLLVAAGLIFVAGILPVLGFVPFQYQYFSTVADHYLYIAMLGPALAVGWLVKTFPRPFVYGATSTVLIALGILSFRQGATWKDDVTIFSQAIKVNPDSFVGHNNLGYGLFRRDISAAEHHFREAIRIKPDYARAHDNLALVLLQIPRPGARDEAVWHIREVLRVSDQMPPALRPNLDVTHLLFGGYLMNEKRYEEAAGHFRDALRINPDNKEAQERLEAAMDLIKLASTRPSTQTAQ